MRKFLISIVLFILAMNAVSASTPKYVFYFIGDGMGVNTVQLTEMYQASVQGRLGAEQMVFSQFPVVSFGTTWPTNANVTDSSASGTALATGTKTVNNHLGLDSDDALLESIAYKAQKKGAKVGIVTSVGMNHATPAAFYAHQPDRNWFYKISLDLVRSGFDFFGAGYIEKKNKLEDGTKVQDIREVMQEAGYTLVAGADDFSEKYQDASKIVMFPAPGKGIGYGLDRKANKKDGLTLKQLTESSLTFLQKDNKKGFFMMVEGGDIDGAAHGHDAATMIHEILDFNDAVQVAVEFYKKHPKQTLIVVTADHDTGSLSLDPYNPDDLAKLSYQKYSQEHTSSILKKMIDARKPEIISWEEIKDFLSEHFGLWTKVPVDWEQEKYLHDTYELTVARSEAGHQIDLYADNALLVARAVQILNSASKVYWGTESHSAGVVPTYVLGVGQEKFSARMDNSKIPQIIAQIANYQ